MVTAERLRIGVAVPAGGSGSRMARTAGEGAGAESGGSPKQYRMLAGEPILLRALRPFLGHPLVVAVVVALPVPDVEAPPEWLRDLDERVRLVGGGVTREASVRAAVEALPDDLDLIAVHDGARPLVSRRVIDRCVAVAAAGTGAVAALRAVDTMKEVDGRRRIVDTPERSSLWHAQTPQIFPRAMLLDAYRRADAEGEGGWDGEVTDDSAFVVRHGGTVRVVEGSSRNIKVTRPADLAMAEALLLLPDDEEEGGM